MRRFSNMSIWSGNWDALEANLDFSGSQEDAVSYGRQELDFPKGVFAEQVVSGSRGSIKTSDLGEGGNRWESICRGV
jgi:hypothetical protein